MPDYNPWGTPIFPGASAFGVGSPAEDAQRQPTIVDNLLSHIAGALGRGFMAPGQALQSTMPITSEQMIAPAQDMSTMMSTGSGAFPASANELRMGIKAYHGSPHDFDAFDLSKIGTGEGAQAYGHGLYFAENEGTAKSYRDALAPVKLTDAQGRPPMNDVWGEMTSAARQAAPNVGYQRANQIAEEVHAGLRNGDDVKAFRRFVDKSDWSADEKAMYRAALDHAEKYNVEKTGKMYEVNINADPEHFLDWDKPLSQQPAVASKLGFSPRSSDQINAEAEALFAKHGQYPNMPPEAKARVAELQAELDKRAPDVAGADYYRQSDPNNFLHSMLAGGSQSERSNQLLQSGIPGIKYLDQGSRPIENLDILKEALAEAKAKGNIESANSLQATIDAQQKQTHNYVVFNDKLVDILKKYAIPGMMAPIFPQVMGEQKS